MIVPNLRMTRRDRFAQMLANSYYRGDDFWFVHCEFLSGGKFLECQGVGSNHMTQSVNKQIGILPAIKAERHFVKVGLQMLGADLVPSSHDTALQQRECRFYAVRVDVSAEADIFFRRVVHGFMFSFANGSRICGKVIGHDYINIGANVLFDVALHSTVLSIFRMEKPQITVALANPDYDFLIGFSLAATSTAILSADVSFIHFDSTVQHGPVNLFHGATYAVEEIPRRLVRAFTLAPKCTLELHGAHALACLYQQQNSHEPRFKRKVGVVEDRLSEHAELIAALDAFKLFLRR